MRSTPCRRTRATTRPSGSGGIIAGRLRRAVGPGQQRAPAQPGHRRAVHPRAPPSSSTRPPPPSRPALITPDLHLLRQRRPSRSRAASTTARPASSTTAPATPPATYNVSSALTVSSDDFFYNLGYLFYAQAGQVRRHAHPGPGRPVRPGRADRHRPARRGRRAGSTARPSGSSSTPRPRRPSPTPPGTPGDNIEMAFGQGGTYITPIEQAVAYATFANGGTRYAPQVAAAVVSPVRPGGQEVHPPGHRPRGLSPADLPGPADRVRRVWSSSPNGHGLRAFQGLQLPRRAGRQDGHGRHRAGQGAHGLVRRVRADRPTPSTWWSASSTRPATGPRPPPRWSGTIFSYLAAHPVGAGGRPTGPEALSEPTSRSRCRRHRRTDRRPPTTSGDHGRGSPRPRPAAPERPPVPASAPVGWP